MTRSKCVAGVVWGVLGLCALVLPQAVSAATLPNGFQDTTVFAGLPEPTAIRFAPDGRVFVAEKAGKIVVYDSLEDTTPTVFADLSAKVFGGGERGLLGLEIDPQFPARPYIYALYTYDHELGEAGEAPRWNDACPNPPGPEINGCVVSSRLVRLTAEGDHAVGSETVLVEDWCQQFGSHSAGALHFGPEGALFASGGDGANYNVADFGQFGYPNKNPCGDPPTGVGGLQTPPTAEGGALRAQDTQTPADPEGLDGTVIRVDPTTGEGLPGNPMYASSDPNRRRVIAYGFRNPSRFAVSAPSNEFYVGNVGQEDFEEIDRFRTTPNPPLQLRLAMSRGVGSPPRLRDPRAQPLRKSVPRRQCVGASVFRLATTRRLSQGTGALRSAGRRSPA